MASQDPMKTTDRQRRLHSSRRAGRSNTKAKDDFLDIVTLIRSIQRTEGLTDCFCRGYKDCDHLDCKWRDYCIQKRPAGK